MLRLERLSDEETNDIDFKSNIYFTFNDILCCLNYKKGYLSAIVNNHVERCKIVCDEEPTAEPNTNQLNLF